MIDIDTSKKTNTDNNDGIFINPNSFYSAYTFLNRNIYKVDEFCDTVNKVDESTLNIVNCSFENIKSSVSSMKEGLEQLSKNIQNMYDILIQDSDFANTFMYYGRQEMIEYFGEDLTEDELLVKIYQSAIKKDEKERSLYEKYIIGTYGEAIEKQMAFEEPLKEYQEQIDIEKEIKKLKDDRSTLEYQREGSEFLGYPTEEEKKKYDADIAELDIKISELNKKLNKPRKRQLEDLLVENGIIESTAGAEFRIATKKIYGSGVEFVDAVKSGNWENIKKEGKEFADIIFSTDAVVTTKIVSGVTKLGEWVDDGLRIAQGWIFGGNLATGIDLLDKHVFGDEGKLKNNKIYQKANENWNETMNFVAEDRVGNAQEYFFEETEIGKQINEESALKYDGKFANATQNFTTNVAKYAAATAVTAFTGIPVITFAVGAVEGLGKNAEQYFSVTDEKGNYKYRNAKGIGLSALGAVEEGANWYIAGNSGNSVLNTAKILHTQSASQVVNNVVSNLRMNKSLLSMNLGQEASKQVAKEALIATLKSPYLYIGTGANVANTVRTTEATGEFNLKNFVTREAFILASSFGGNYVQSKLNYSRIALTNQWMNPEVQGNTPALVDGNNYAYSLLDEKGNTIANYDQDGVIINTNAPTNNNVGLQVYNSQNGLSVPNNINPVTPDSGNAIIYIRPELYMSSNLVKAAVDSKVDIISGNDINISTDIGKDIKPNDTIIEKDGRVYDATKVKESLDKLHEEGMNLQLFAKKTNISDIDVEEVYDRMTYNNKKLDNAMEELHQYSKTNPDNEMVESVLKKLDSVHEDIGDLQRQLISSKKVDVEEVYDRMTYNNKKLDNAMEELYQYSKENPKNEITDYVLKKLDSVHEDVRDLQRELINIDSNSEPKMSSGIEENKIAYANSSNTYFNEKGEIIRENIVNVTQDDLAKEGIPIFEPPTEPDLFDANNLQLSSNPKLRELQEKVISGQPLSMMEKVIIGRDNTFKELLGYKLKSNCAYRAVRREVFEKYKELGYVAGLNSNLEPLLDDEYLINENNKGVDWYLGGAAPKYGKIIIECPADKNYFVLAADSGNGMSNDPTVRFIKSSGSQKPIPFDKITRVIDLENNIIIENKNIQNNQSLNLSPKTNLDTSTGGLSETKLESGKAETKIVGRISNESNAETKYTFTGEPIDSAKMAMETEELKHGGMDLQLFAKKMTEQEAMQRQENFEKLDNVAATIEFNSNGGKSGVQSLTQYLLTHNSDLIPLKSGNFVNSLSTETIVDYITSKGQLETLLDSVVQKMNQHFAKESGRSDAGIYQLAAYYVTEKDSYIPSVYREVVSAVKSYELTKYLSKYNSVLFEVQSKVYTDTINKIVDSLSEYNGVDNFIAYTLTGELKYITTEYRDAVQEIPKYFIDRYIENNNLSQNVEKVKLILAQKSKSNNVSQQTNNANSTNQNNNSVIESTRPKEQLTSQQEKPLLNSQAIKQKSEFNGLELKKEIISKVDMSKSKAAIAKKAYLELNKRVHYDANYLSLHKYNNNIVKDNIYKSKNLSFETMVDENVICKSWAYLYKEILIDLGFDINDVTIMGDDSLNSHKWIEIDLHNGKIIIADATEAGSIVDVEANKFTNETNGFVVVDKSNSGKRILYDYNLGKESVQENIKIDKELRKNWLESIEKYRSTYMVKKISKETLSSDAKVYQYISDISIPDNWDGLEVYQYLNVIHKKMRGFNYSVFEPEFYYRNTSNGQKEIVAKMRFGDKIFTYSKELGKQIITINNY